MVLAGKSHGQRSLADYDPQGRKELDVTEATQQAHIPLNLLFYIQQCVYGASQVAPEVKNPSANAGDTRDVGLISGLGKTPGGGNGDPLQYSCLEDHIDSS